MDLSLIVPCYNEEENVNAFFEETQKVLSNQGFTYEYVFVNDGSSDKTKQLLAELIDNNPQCNIVVVNFSRNFGKESAIFAGMKNSTGENTCIIDADLQQSPSIALDMYKMLVSNEDLNCVCAYQSVRKESKFVSGLKSLFYKIINKLAETEFKNGASDFRVFDSKVKNAMLNLGEYHRFSKGIFSWVGFNTYFMEYEANERNAGDSKWNLAKLFKYAINGIIAFSTAPLKFSTWVGGIAILFSIVYSIVTIIRKLVNNINVDGFTQLALLITFFTGILLFTIGIIGEYIAKIYQQVKNRPVYIIDNVLKTNALMEKQDGNE